MISLQGSTEGGPGLCSWELMAGCMGTAWSWAGEGQTGHEEKIIYYEAIRHWDRLSSEVVDATCLS